MNEKEASHLVRLLFALSSARLGSAILIAHDPANLPPIVKAIDHSLLGAELVRSLGTLKLDQQHAASTLFGILSSDGLTTFSKDGTLLAAGQIIALDPNQTAKGGGRSQAVAAASSFGLALKVSEDGPISLFKNGEQLLKIEI
jgi:hypothetical protein